MDIVRSEEDINELLNACSDAEEEGSNFPGMSYEQGIKYMYEWLIDMHQSNPLE